MPISSSKLTGAYATPGAASRSTPSNCTTDAVLRSSSKIGMLKDEVLESIPYGCVTWSPRSYHKDALGRAYRKHKRIARPVSYLETLKTESERIEAILRKRRILFAGFVLRMEDTRLPKCVIFGDLVGVRFQLGDRKRSGWGEVWKTSELSVSRLTSVRSQLKTQVNATKQ